MFHKTLAILYSKHAKMIAKLGNILNQYFIDYLAEVSNTQFIIMK